MRFWPPASWIPRCFGNGPRRGACDMTKVSWDDAERPINSINELEALLDDIHGEAIRRRPCLASIELSPTGASLSIGLGREVSILNYVSGTGNPPYFSSSGGLSADEAVHFYFMGDWSEYPLRNTIPVEVARRAVRYFYQTGQLDPAVTWEEV